MEYDGRLKTVKEALQGVDGGSISSFASSSEAAYTALNGSFGNISDGLQNPSIWTDDVQTQFGDTLNICKSAIASLSAFPSQVAGVGGAIGPLVSSIEEYMKSVDSYNSLEEEYNKCRNELGSRPSKSADESVYHYNARLASWNGKNNQINMMQAQLVALETSIEGQKAACYSQMAAIEGMLSGAPGEGAGAGAGAIAGGSGGNGYRSFSETDEKTGNTRNVTEWYDEDGNKIGEDYSIVDSDGNTFEKGSKTYYDNGNVKTWKYDSDQEAASHYPDPELYDHISVKNKEVVYRPDGTIERESAEEVILKNNDGSRIGVIKDVKRRYNADEEVIYDRIERYETSSGYIKVIYDGMEYNYEDGVNKISYDKYEYIDEIDPEANQYLKGYLLTYDEEGNRHEYIKEGKEYDPYFNETVSYEEFEEITWRNEEGKKELLRHYDKFEKSDGTVYESVNSTRKVDNDGNAIYETKAREIAYQDGKKEKNVTEIVDLESKEKPLTERRVETTYNEDGSISHGTHEKYEAKLDEKGHRTGDVKVSETIDEMKYKDGTKAQNIERKYDNEQVVEEKTGRIDRAGGGTVVNETKTYNEDGSIERHVDAEDATGMGIDIKYDATTTYNEDGSYTETIGSHANRGDSITNETIRHNEDGNVTQYYQEENQHNDFSKDTGVNVHYDENGQYESVDIESHTDNEKGIFGQTVEKRDIHRDYEDGAITHEESDIVGQIGGIDVINVHNEKDYKTQNT